MSKFEDQFDKLIDDHKKDLNKGKQLFIECFLAEINLHKYDTPDLIISALNTHLDALDNELARQYEADAKADHFTENQFNV